MHDLKKKYDEMADAYDSLMRSVEDIEETSGISKVFASFDVYTLEPFYQETNNISNKKMKTYESKEALSGGEDIYECWLKGNEIIYTRNTEFVDMFKDSFFIHENNVIWKYEFYVSSESQNLAGVQCLIIDDENNLLSLKYYNQFGSYERSYTHSGNITFITTTSTSTSRPSKTKVIFDESRNNVIKMEMLTNDGDFTLYERRKNKPNEKVLLKKIKKIIIDTVIKTLKEQDIINKEIAFILFDYHFDAPFYPAVGLCQTEEKKSLAEECGPLAVYGTAEMEYFSENENPCFDFYSKPASRTILDELHKLVDYNHEYEGKKQLIIDTYIDVCKELMAHSEIKDYIKVAKDFHIVANDFSEINVEVYLKALLPRKQFEALEIEGRV